jgi:uncharacterized membrane protein
MEDRILRLVCVIIGMIAVVVSLLFLLHHQYTFIYRNYPMNEPPIWTSIFVLLLAGIWLFLFGLHGLVDEKQRKGTNPNE